ncbi:MAG TPA: type II toxin-antitoxin system prevent-host-death family antitoxin [Ignavibacteria bacterium]|nr:type II toxin-antitoxin system prevent-host-death family antitoxin [Ignavibacteria bacterium]
MKNDVKVIGSFGAKTHLSSLLDEVKNGAEYIITKRGKPVAKLTSPGKQKDNMDIKQIIMLFDKIRADVKGKVNIKEYIAEGRKY